MDLNWLESIIYSVISGFTEILPVPSRAHNALYLFLIGSESAPILDLFIHIAVLFALLMNTQNYLSAVKRARKLAQIPPSRRKRQPNYRLLADWKLIRVASIPVILSIVVSAFTYQLSGRFQFLAIFLFLNGILLYITGHIPIGSKNSRDMTSLEGFLIGVAASLSCLPGFSRMGSGLSVALMRGSSKTTALTWMLIITIPAMVGVCILDIISIASVGMGSFGFLALAQCFVCAVIAYICASMAISFMRFLAIKLGFSAFSYYSFGLALFAFVLFMI